MVGKFLLTLRSETISMERHSHQSRNFPNAGGHRKGHPYEPSFSEIAANFIPCWLFDYKHPRRFSH